MILLSLFILLILLILIKLGIISKAPVNILFRCFLKYIKIYRNRSSIEKCVSIIEKVGIAMDILSGKHRDIIYFTDTTYDLSLDMPVIYSTIYKKVAKDVYEQERVWLMSGHVFNMFLNMLTESGLIDDELYIEEQEHEPEYIAIPYPKYESADASASVISFLEAVIDYNKMYNDVKSAATTALTQINKKNI